jgi:hypothetical protein
MACSTALKRESCGYPAGSTTRDQCHVCSAISRFYKTNASRLLLLPQVARHRPRHYCSTAGTARSTKPAARCRGWMGAKERINCSGAAAQSAISSAPSTAALIFCVASFFLATSHPSAAHEFITGRHATAQQGNLGSDYFDQRQKKDSRPDGPTSTRSLSSPKHPQGPAPPKIRPPAAISATAVSFPHERGKTTKIAS